MPPLARDKIIINSIEIAGDDAISRGNAEAIQKTYASALMLAEEIDKAGWLKDPQALDFLLRQEQLCAKYEGDHYHYHDHQTEHLKEMRTLVNDMRLWIDKRLQKP